MKGRHFGVPTGQTHGTQWSQLPTDMQLLVLEHIPLLQLAQMAYLGKEMRAAYLARLALREAVISSLPRVSDGVPGSRPVTLGDLLAAQPQLSTALPRETWSGSPRCAFPPLTHLPTPSLT
jgi:hypothetical protein